MSKFDELWQYISTENKPELTLSFDDVKQICGIPIDHSFLTYKKELLPLGFEVKHISLKNKTIEIIKSKA